MPDADGRTIPLVDDDQGEGIKDFYEELSPDMQVEHLHRALERHNKIEEEIEKGRTQSEMLQLILTRVEELDRKINLIFDGHVLINGQFIKPEGMI